MKNQYFFIDKNNNKHYYKHKKCHTLLKIKKKENKMFGIINNTEFLTAIGINDAPEEQKATLVAGIEDLIKEKLITEMSNRLTDAEAEEFGNITDEDQAYEWLNTHVPDLNDIVKKIIADVQYDIIKRRTEIVGD